MAACLPAELLSQSGKRVLDCATVEFTATRGEKEHLRLERRRHRPVADACIIREHMRGTGVQGNHTRSSEFSFLERKQAVGEIDVATLKRQRLREAQTPQFFPFGAESWNPDPRAAEIVRAARAVVAIGESTAAYIKEATGVSPVVIHPPIYGAPPFGRLGGFDRGSVWMINPCQVKG